jgi:GrpB-like predicted nucleotidyltransferase (UPF0157 family)
MAAGRSTVVVDYDDRWPTHFEIIRDVVWPAVAAQAMSIEHVGSTAVPGLAAKPVIDVDVVVEDERLVAPVIRSLEGLGYEHQGDLGIRGREAFSILPDVPEHHLYVVVFDSRAHRDHVDFRDYLRGNAAAVEAYAAEKRRLAHLLGSDRDAYVEGKSWLVHDLLRAARLHQDAEPR